MEKYYLKDGVKLLCVKAKSFPEGVKESFEKLEKLLPSKEGRDFYGISYPDKGNITYFAAVKEAFEGETEALGCQAFTIPGGTYTSIYITDFMKDITSLGSAFKELLDTPGIDPNGYCLEMYINDKDVRCMVRLDPKQNYAEDFILQLNSSFREIHKLLSSLDNVQLNTKISDESWTAGQLAKHVIKTSLGFLRLLNGPADQVDRNPDEMVDRIKSDLLNFNMKVKAAKRVEPENINYNKEDLLNTIELINGQYTDCVKNLDLSQKCLTFKIPVYGYLTRLEAITFIIYHTQRHTHQLRNIIDNMKNLKTN